MYLSSFYFEQELQILPSLPREQAKTYEEQHSYLYTPRHCVAQRESYEKYHFFPRV